MTSYKPCAPMVFAVLIVREINSKVKPGNDNNNEYSNHDDDDAATESNSISADHIRRATLAIGSRCSSSRTAVQ